jgi:signal transduction histidine kinase
MDWYPRIRGWARDVFYLAMLCMLAVLAVFLFQGGTRAPDPVQVFRRAFMGSFLISFCIGGLSWLAMPPVARWIGARPALVRWPMYLATMTVTGTAGTLLAGIVYYYGLGYTFNRTFPGLVGEALLSSIPITWLVGSIITVQGIVSARLQHTELELRTQQLEKERVEKLVTEAQLASLASRVQPHFLFNTLNSISALVREDPARAEALIERLASLLRSSLDGARTIPLESELCLVADYLEIQQARFGERLRYELPSVAGIEAAVPPFAVQSIVENALKHVGGRRAEGVTITVSAAQTGADLLVDITDDGPGFAEDALKANHGLDNLQLRLRALYGERAGLEFVRPPAGMTVRLRVPAT